MTTATGSTWARSTAGVNATMPNATATPPTARASADATCGARRGLWTISRASRGSRSTIQAKHPAGTAASTPRAITKGSRPTWVTAGTQIRVSAKEGAGRVRVTGREPARRVRGPQRVRVVAEVDQGVAGQAMRPVVGGVQGYRPVGGGYRLGIAVRAQVRAGHQAPGPAALWL